MCAVVDPIYFEMLSDYLGPTIFKNEYTSTSTNRVIEDRTYDSPVYLQNGVSYIAKPTTYEMYSMYNSFNSPRTYIPYKRISHFREHINRLIYSQTITISQPCLDHVNTLFKEMPSLKNDVNIYSILHRSLYKHGFSKYVEHIHHLISRVTKKYLNIEYDHYYTMRKLFKQIEFEFTHFPILEGRKNFISYHIIIQFMLFLLHVHPRYYLPTIKDPIKRAHYYSMCLEYFKNTQMYDKLYGKFLSKHANCPHCTSFSFMFDPELVSILLPS